MLSKNLPFCIIHLPCLPVTFWQYGKWRIAECVTIYRDINPMRATGIRKFTVPVIFYIACCMLVFFIQSQAVTNFIEYSLFSH